MARIDLCHYIIGPSVFCARGLVSIMRDFSNNDFFVDPDIRRAESLPVSAFTDPDFLELEMERIFNKTWMLAPHQGSPNRSTAFNEFPNKPGSRIPFSLMGKPLFLQRNSKNEINCFPNV